MVEAGDLKSYFANARTWEQDRLLAADRSRRIAWVTAGVASLLAVVSVGAVAALTPLKTVEPFVIRVDSATGIVDVVNAFDNAREIYDEAVTRYFAARAGAGERHPPILHRSRAPTRDHGMGPGPGFDR